MLLAREGRWVFMNNKISKIRHVVLDMDGTIYLGGTLFDETLPFLALLRRRGIGYTFVTNNCARSRAQYVARLNDLGIAIDPDAVSTSAHATIHYLRTHLARVKRLFVLGTPGLFEDLRLADFEVVDDRPDAVLVAFDTELTYNRLAQTAYWIQQGLPYIATHPDRVCPTDRPIVLPDCGSICALFESATGRRPDAVPGKPSAEMLRAVIDRERLAAEEVAMVGDRVYTDIRMARDAGSLAVLTLTGETKRDDLKRLAESERADIVVESLAELGAMLDGSC